MGALRFVGGAPLTAQVSTCTPSTVTIDDVYTITLTNKAGMADTISFTATTDVEKDMVEALHTLAVARKTAGTVPWSEVTATENDVALTLTADTAGDGFTMVSGVTGTGTCADATTTTNSSPRLLSLAENYEGQVAPANGDSITVVAELTTNIDGEDMTGVTLVGFTVEEGYSGTIGSRIVPVQLQMLHSAAYYNVELGGTGETYLDVDNYGTINISHAASASEAGQFGCNIVGTLDASADGIILVDCQTANENPSIGLAANPGEDLEMNALKVSGGDVEIGSAVTEQDDSTAPDVTQSGGEIISYAAVGALAQSGGIHTQEEGAIASLDCIDARCNYNSTSTLAGNPVVAGKGHLDFSGNLKTKTVTNPVDVYKGGKVTDPNKTVTTLVCDLHKCNLKEVTLDIGTHVRITRGAVA